MTLAGFPETYEQARSAFKNAALRVGAVVDSREVYEDLTIDVASLGSDNPDWALVVSSGMHGVEGFIGSAIQLNYLDVLDRAALAPNGQLVLIHAVNPYGFSYLRRVNEDNVDLNRNFLEPAEYEGADPLYEKVNTFLNPGRIRDSTFMYYAKVGALISRYGFQPLRQVVTRGQYEFPQGLFFGGIQAAASYRILEQKFREWVRAKHVFLDLHSGLGRYGRCTLLTASSTDMEKYSKEFGLKGDIVGKDSRTAYETKGDLEKWVREHCRDKDYHFLTAEFGTYWGLRILLALRNENAAHFDPQASQEAISRAKQDLLECFCPRSFRWRSRVVKEGLQLLSRAQKAAAELA